MNRTKARSVKICGLSSIGHMRAAEALGVDYVGLITEVSRSPRCISRRQARMMARAAHARPVMVTIATDAREIEELARFVQPSVVQLHGQGTELLGTLRERLPDTELWHVIAIEAGNTPDLDAAKAEIEAAIAAGADRLLLDAAKGGKAGGTGTTMSWDAAASLVEFAEGTPVILAGGLNPGNVAEAIRRVRPAGVDVSSGVESAPNVKSPVLIRAFFEAVRQVTTF